MNILSLGDSLGSRSDSFNDRTTVKDNISNDGEKIVPEETSVMSRLEKFRDDNMKSSRYNLIEYVSPNGSIAEQGTAILKAIKNGITILGLKDVMSNEHDFYPVLPSYEEYLAAWMEKFETQRNIANLQLSKCSVMIKDSMERLKDVESELHETKLRLITARCLQPDTRRSAEDILQEINESKSKVEELNSKKDSLEDRILELGQREIQATESVSAIENKVTSGAIKQLAFNNMALSRSKVQEGALVKYMHDAAAKSKEVLPYMSKMCSDISLFPNPFDPMEEGLARLVIQNLREAFEDGSNEVSAVMYVFQGIKTDISKKNILQRIRCMDDFIDRLRRMGVIKISTATLAALLLLINGSEENRTDYFKEENMLKLVEKQSGDSKSGSVVDGELSGGLYNRVKQFFEQAEQINQQNQLFSQAIKPVPQNQKEQYDRRQREIAENKVLLATSDPSKSVCFSWSPRDKGVRAPFAAKCMRGNECHFKLGHTLIPGDPPIDEFGATICKEHLEKGTKNRSGYELGGCVAMEAGIQGIVCKFSHLPVYLGPDK